jgi:hypothetical protein
MKIFERSLVIVATCFGINFSVKVHPIPSHLPTLLQLLNQNFDPLRQRLSVRWPTWRRRDTQIRSQPRHSITNSFTRLSHLLHSFIVIPSAHNDSRCSLEVILRADIFALY